MTLPEKQLIKIFKTAECDYDDKCARILGVNMEGPFICAEKRGAQEEIHIKKPDIKFFTK